MQNKIKQVLCLLLSLGIISYISIGYSKDSTAGSGPKTKWNRWVAELRTEAIAKGINPELFDDVFRNIKAPDRKTLRLDKSQPETRLTFSKYRKTRGDNYRIKLGQNKYKRYHNILEEVGDNYGVDPCFITAIWGIESSYGHFMGNFPVIKSLASLAYDNRRSEFFRKELLLALEILQEGHVSFADYKGEWAGGSGQSQFLPSSFKRYAVDYDQDGHKDIWKTKPDVFASIANYLHQNGWTANQPWGTEVVLPRRFDRSLIGYEHSRPVEEWQQLGVRSKSGSELPYFPSNAAVIEPYGGPPLLVYDNFRVLLKYNNSTFYAGTVCYIADKICRR